MLHRRYTSQLQSVLRQLTGLKRTECMESAPQVSEVTGSERSWSHTSTAAPAVAKVLSLQWWSIPLQSVQTMLVGTSCG